VPHIALFNNTELSIGLALGAAPIQSPRSARASPTQSPRTNPSPRTPKERSHDIDKLFAQHLTLPEVLQDTTLRNTFKEYLKSVYSSESLLFWERVEAYKLAEDRVEEARKIEKEFFMENSLCEINTSQSFKDAVRRNIEHGTCNEHLFDSIVWELTSETGIMADCFRRFKTQNLTV
jgi:hypothetical protein